MLAGFGVAWLAFWGWVVAAPPPSELRIVAFLVGYVAMGVTVTVALRDIMLEHRLNREMTLVHLAMLTTSAVLSLMAPRLGLSVPSLLIHLMFIWALGMAAIAAIVEPLSLVPAGVWLLAALAGALWPEALRPGLAVGAAAHVLVPVLVSLRVRR